jgi:hypothetical protein
MGSDLDHWYLGTKLYRTNRNTVPSVGTYLLIVAVLRIRDVYPGSEFLPPGSGVIKIPDPGSGSTSKN